MKATIRRILVPSVVSLLVTMVGVNVYRASTQSITYDEAFTYQTVSSPISRILTDAGANNHVLFTLLAKATTAAFGPSELTLRLPSVVAGVAYFAAIFLIGRFVLGDGLAFALSIVALALNPFVLDFLSVGRGYGLALAAFMIAFYELTLIVAEPDVDPPAKETLRWIGASLALAASVLANLAFVFPSVSLGLSAMTLAALKRMSTRRSGLRRFIREVVLCFCLPGPVAVIAALARWLGAARLGNFYYGAANLNQTVQSLVEMSLRHHPSAWPVNTDGATVMMLAEVTATVLVPLTLIFLAAVAAIVVIRGVRAETMEELTRMDRVLVLLAGTTALTTVMLVAIHWLWQVPYPLDRTGLYFIPLVILGLGLLAARTNSREPWTGAVGLSAFGLLGGLVIQSILQFNVSQYGMWHFDSGTHTLYQIIASWPHADAENRFRVAASTDYFAPSLMYYQQRDATPRVESISDGWTDTQAGEFDFFVIEPGDVQRVQPIGTLVCVHPVSNAMLFVNRTRPAGRDTPSTGDCLRLLRSLHGHT